MIDREALERLDDARLAAWDTHRLDAFVDLLADDFVLRDTTVGAPITTRDGAREYVQAWLTALPDMRIRRTSRLVDEDDGAVAAEVEFTGTHRSHGGGFDPGAADRQDGGWAGGILRSGEGWAVRGAQHPPRLGGHHGAARPDALTLTRKARSRRPTIAAA
ncbi:nuclear transport factor 2 family protein [Micromonospora sp. NPDC047738]|uniref:nuclear transport factor 2 family protein n=1 Tax=Micromonospora sp. NPDC047738 TaxID=3155741 RepID=UPI0033F18A49